MIFLGLALMLVGWFVVILIMNLFGSTSDYDQAEEGHKSRVACGEDTDIPVFPRQRTRAEIQADIDRIMKKDRG